MKINATVDRLLKINQEEQKIALRKFTKLSISEKVEIFDIQRDIFYKIKQVNQDLAINLLSYVSFIKAIHKYHNNVYKVDRFVAQIKGRSLKKQPKRDKLLGYWSLIKTLKAKENLSFREISKYLKKYHKFDVAHSLIYNLWTEFENNTLGEINNDG